MIEEQEAERLFIDKASGKNTDRTAYKEIMAFVCEGDTAIVESRLCRKVQPAFPFQIAAHNEFVSDLRKPHKGGNQNAYEDP